MRVKADIHHHQNSDDNFGSQNKVEVEETHHSFASSSQNRNQRSGPIAGFGLQALGPLSAKKTMKNIKFQGRQFAVATNEKVKCNVYTVLTQYQNCYLFHLMEYP